MRLNGAGLVRGQREYTLPTAQSFAHMTTALYKLKISPTAATPYTGHVYNGSTRFAPPISDRSRLIPELEKTLEATRVFHNVSGLGRELQRRSGSCHWQAAHSCLTWDAPEWPRPD